MPDAITDWDATVSNVSTSPETFQSDNPETGEGATEPAAGQIEGVVGPQPETIGRVPSGISENLVTQLRPIGEATYGPADALPETVHGEDDRIQITHTATYPWRIHASLRITAADGSAWIGTGWFIGPRTLITAGHVVYIKNSPITSRNGWVRRIEVIPGRNVQERPYGSAVSQVFHSVTGWSVNGDPEYDYGAIVLPKDSPMGRQTGWIGFAAYADDELKTSHLNISGYPGDKPEGTQWYDHRNTDSVTERKVFYDIDTFGGQSGSAVYKIVNGTRFSVGIHAYGGSRVNSATRINQRRFENLQAWNNPN